MRIRRVEILHVRIPLKRKVRHASYSRTENETVLACCELADGTRGWGEGLPRPYVTGESIETAWQHLVEFPYQQLGEEFSDAPQLMALCDGIRLPVSAGQRECFGNSARCALELAVLDAGCRALGISLAEFIRSAAEDDAIARSGASSVRYSGALTGSTLRKMLLLAGIYRATGFHYLKVKVGLKEVEDSALLRRVRRIVGRQMRLRIDANEAWQPDEIARRTTGWEPLNIAYLEQPVPHEMVGQLAAVHDQIAIPIMLDESLCSSEDAQRAVEENLCDAFNVRISKCGGILPSLRLMEYARQHCKDYQLGCQVGETGILSAAGRHLASAVNGLCALEGSFERFLVHERLTREDLTFGWGGRAPALTGPGLGVEIDPEAVERVTERRTSFDVS